MILHIKHLKRLLTTCNIGGIVHGPLVEGWCSICHCWAGGKQIGDAVEGDF